MNSEEFDDLLKLAVANIVQPEPSQSIKEAIASLPRAPLATVIDDLLAQRSRIAVRRELEAIASLNQGTPDDLDTAEFKSYIVAQTGIAEKVVAECAQEIGIFRRVSEATARDESIAMAARDEEGLGSCQIAASAFYEQLKKSDE